MEIRAGNSHITGYKPSLDCNLHNGNLCTSGNCPSYLSSGVCRSRLCGGLYGTQACDATWVGALLLSIFLAVLEKGLKVGKKFGNILVV